MTLSYLQIVRIIDRMRKILSSRGARGPTGLYRIFTTMDTSGDGVLDFGEFQQAIKELKLALTNQEIRSLFVQFDTDGNADHHIGTSVGNDNKNSCDFLT